MKNKDVEAVVVAAGEGTRLGAGRAKALVPVLGRPMIAWCVEALDRSDLIVGIVVVAPEDKRSEIAAAVSGCKTPLRIVPGGASRAESVTLGIDATGRDRALVLIHDAARPLLTPAMVAAVIGGIETADGAILAAPLADSLKSVDARNEITGAPSREGLWCAQTPQAFRAEAFREAIAEARARGTLHLATDCASLMTYGSRRVRVVDTGAPNIKITTPSDLHIVEALLAQRTDGEPVG